MKKQINLAIQILPSASDDKVYQLVDAAIDVIIQSGLKYKVCPFETVIEGPYDEVMQIAEKAQEACFAAGADKLMVYFKIQRNKNQDVFIDDKMEKY